MCEKVGHVAKNCWGYNVLQVQNLVVNMAQAMHNSNPHNQPWIVDRGDTHTHATSNLGNLTQLTNYGGPEDLFVADGSGLKILKFWFYNYPYPCQTLRVHLVRGKIPLHDRLPLRQNQCSQC